jgi:hypothetical protein
MGVDEMGLGLVNDPDNEISGTSLVRIALGAGLTGPVMFQMNSVQTGESWQVQGSNSPTMGFTTQFTGNDQLTHTLPTFFNFYTFSATSGNVLLASISAAAIPGPIVGAGLPGLVVACGALIALARRRRRQRIA